MARLIHLYAEDFLCLAKASLPLLNRGLTLILGDNQDTLAADNNGAGKTTLAKAITWGLFGETLDKDKYDEVIRDGTKRTYVRQVFERAGNLWIVRRTREKGSPGLSLSRAKTRKFNVDWDEVEQEDFDGSAAEVQAKICELVGKDFRAFCNTQFFGQGDIGRFYSSTDAVRKDSIHRVLRSDIYRRAEKHLREKVMRPLRQAVTDLEADLRSVADKRGEYNLEDLKRRQTEFEEYRGRQVESAVDSIRTVEAETRRDKAELQVERDRLSSELTLLRKEATNYDKEGLTEELRRQEALAESLRAETRDRAGQMGEIRSRVKVYDEQLARLEGDECPTCSSPLGEGKPLELKTALAKRRDAWVEGLRDFKRSQDEAETELASANDRARELRVAIQRAERVDINISTYVDGLERVDAELKRVQREARKKAQSIIEQMDEWGDRENPFDSSVETAEARLAELNKQECELLESLEAARTEVAMREYWLRAFGPQGIPSLLLDSVMPYLTQRSNHHLETLTDGDITVEITNQRDLKKGAKKEEIVVACCIEGVQDAKPSVGQKKKLEIATNMALMDLAVVQDGESDLLVMDEVLDGLDAEGVSRVLRLLDELRAKRPSIFVVTHDPSLAESFEHAVLVTKRDKASTVAEVK